MNSEPSDSFVPPALDQARLEAITSNIARRRSMGLARLHPDPVDRRLIETALEAANWAPSNGDTEPWRFTVFTGEGRAALGEAFAEAYRSDAEADGTFRQETFEAMRDKVWSAPVWISIGMTPGFRPDGSRSMPDDDEIMAVACAVQNLHLVFTEMGISGLWHSKGTSVHPKVAEFLGLKPPSQLLGFFFCGYPKIAWPEGERRPLAEKVSWRES